jgi:hypothetical protein
MEDWKEGKQQLSSLPIQDLIFPEEPSGKDRRWQVRVGIHPIFKKNFISCTLSSFHLRTRGIHIPLWILWGETYIQTGLGMSEEVSWDPR